MEALLYLLRLAGAKARQAREGAGVDASTEYVRYAVKCVEYGEWVACYEFYSNHRTTCVYL